MQVQTVSPLQWLMNTLPTRYVNAPTTVITDLVKVAVTYASVKYIAVPIVRACTQQVGRKVVPILQNKVTQMACGTIALAGGVYLAARTYFNDDTPLHEPLRLGVVNPNTPAVSPFNTFI